MATLADLRAEEVHSLTEILQLHASDDFASYSQHVTNLISSLPRILKRPKSMTLCSLFHKSSIARTSEEISLCSLHRPLSPFLIKKLFTLVALEVGLRLNSLVAHNHYLTLEQWTLVSDLRVLHSLWLPSDTYQNTFLEPPPKDRQRIFQGNCCEACILAKIGGNVRALEGLRTVLLSRKVTHRPRRRGPPRLLRWVDAWIQNCGPGLSGEMLRKSDDDGAVLKVVRKRIWKERREKRRREAMGCMPTNGTSLSTVEEKLEECDEEDEDDDDWESKMIDHYAALLSTPHLPQQSFILSQSSFTTSLTTAINVSASESNYSLYNASGITQSLTSPPGQTYPFSTRPHPFDPTSTTSSVSVSAEHQAQLYRSLIVPQRLSSEQLTRYPSPTTSPAPSSASTALTALSRTSSALSRTSSALSRTSFRHTSHANDRRFSRLSIASTAFSSWSKLYDK